MSRMNAKALVLTSALVAVAGSAHAGGSTEEARGSGRAAAGAGERSRPVRAGSDGSTVSHAGGAHVQDDYGEALAQARRRHVPVVVDVWAPW
jgi:hypothetical protein